MKKAKLTIKPAAMSLVLIILEKMQKHCDDESAVRIQSIFDFFNDRIEKPYHFLPEDDLTVIWSVIKSCFDDDLLVLNNDEFKAVYEVYSEIAKLLDNKESKEWKNFTLIQNSADFSHTNDTNQEK